MTEKSFCSSDELNFTAVSDCYKAINEKIAAAMEKSGRKDSVRLMAVTKTVPPEKINYAVSLGATLLGENRVQEFIGKFEFYDKKSEIHFIGDLQNNKVKYIIDKVSMIHSVNSAKLAEEISKRAEKADKTMDILVEVNVAGEASKSGVSLDKLDELVAYCTELKNIRLRGLMAIPPRDADGSNEKYFSIMQRLFEDNKKILTNTQFDTLSMGMSGDYEEAIKYGSTIVRLGSALFGYRK